MDKGWEEVQKRTFTKWCNNHLVKRHGKDAAISQIDKDFETGIKLMELVNALYGNPMPQKYNKAPKAKPFKLDNIELALKMLDEAGVKTHFLKPNHLVDCDQTMILGMIWSIILDYQIKGISVEELSAKEGLLLWCKKKTAGYKDVKVENFTTSWQDGLAFCALIHKHRPDLLNFDECSKADPKKNLLLAFDVAEKSLGIPRLLEPEDLLDTARPDERSIVTYVSEYFHCFSSQNQGEAAARRIQKMIEFAMATDKLKDDYLERAKKLVAWIKATTENMNERSHENTVESVEGLWEKHRDYKKTTKPEKTNEKLGVEEAFNNLQAKLRVNNRPPFVAPEGFDPKDIDQLWNTLGSSEVERADWLRKELERLQKLENLASRFFKKAKALLQYASDNRENLESKDYGDSVAAVQAKLNIHDGFESSFKVSQGRLETCVGLGKDLIQQNYGKKDAVQAKIDELHSTFEQLAQLSGDRRKGLEAELKRQQALDNLRLEFANHSRSLITHIEDDEDLLSEPVRSFSVSAIETIKASFEQFLKEFDQHAAEFSELKKLSEKLESEGITSNMYAQFTIGQVAERWSRLNQEVEDKKTAIEKELSRQQHNESLCKDFAAKGKAFADWCSEQKEEVSKLTGDINKQLETLRAKVTLVGDTKSSLDEVADLARQIDDANITHNPHTDLTIDTLKLTYENLGDLISKQAGLLETELLKQSGSRVSPEQLSEFNETFKQFDKDNTGTLEKHEFKACLSALGHYSTDEQVTNLVNSLGKKQPGKIVFEEFVEYMVSKTEDTDTPATINNSFKTIAGDRDYVTEDELKRFMDANTVAYLLKHMPSLGNGQYDYKAYTKASYT